MSEYATTSYLLAFGPAAVIALGTILAALISARKTVRQDARVGTGGTRDVVARTASIVAAGMAIAVISILFTLFDNQNSISDRVSRINEDSFVDNFSSSPVGIELPSAQLDKEAAAIIHDQAGSKRWDGLTVGDVRYVRKMQRVESVNPDPDSQKKMADSCIIEVLGKIKIKGFNVESVPIRLSPIPTTSRVLPIPRVKLGLGRAAISPAMSSAS